MGYLNKQLEKIASPLSELALAVGLGGGGLGALTGALDGQEGNKVLSSILGGTGGAAGGLGGLFAANKLGAEGSKLSKILAKSGKPNLVALPLLAALPALGIGAGSLLGRTAADKLNK
jgi:hypothetical protein